MKKDEIKKFIVFIEIINPIPNSWYETIVLKFKQILTSILYMSSMKKHQISIKNETKLNFICHFHEEKKNNL